MNLQEIIYAKVKKIKEENLLKQKEGRFQANQCESNQFKQNIVSNWKFNNVIKPKRKYNCFNHFLIMELWKTTYQMRKIQQLHQNFSQEFLKKKDKKIKVFKNCQGNILPFYKNVGVSLLNKFIYNLFLLFQQTWLIE
ncbi:unnamed protein product (macronuclear) [Paramecium tetraurelia]|uniref:Transmembrane protein n=1 Tax=Paramecium tetraurelia TaxID=5888 RepID=A0BHE7_PARTE|nr:uncharacterized protein GSPATT00028999001 [Paramecium tetraurelia]CAK57964.1 unnamed protein product [Paramecium tetraurelia]|eukprot:XP_001425362.1 hypothetical protein (macronuclear) [Paramecium tetraurelia strain d4-2]